MTGFDLHLVTKEELHKEMVERYVSPMTITPAPSTVTPEPEPTPEPKVIISIVYLLTDSKRSPNGVSLNREEGIFLSSEDYRNHAL